MSIYENRKACRLCGASLYPVISLGEMAMTGIFPKEGEDGPPSGPLTLSVCSSCKLVQLGQDYNPDLLYGDSYGYRSGLNKSMVRHLEGLADRLSYWGTQSHLPLSCLDIGSNDGTLLRAFSKYTNKLVGVDPLISKFEEFYEGVPATLVPEFFTADAVHGLGKFDVITSVAMLYDLQDPAGFASTVRHHLAPGGVWYTEQAYLPFMLAHTAFDGICHEHLEYYTLSDIKLIADLVGLVIVDVDFNDVNGGSFGVLLGRKGEHVPYNKLDFILSLEQCLTRDQGALMAFSSRMHDCRVKLHSRLESLRDRNYKVFGCGASTKGNVLLQYCGITEDVLPFIVDVNEDKWGRRTPGTNIPIISEEVCRAQDPSHMVVLPWHFRQSICERESAFLKEGGALIFPLPTLHEVRA